MMKMTPEMAEESGYATQEKAAELPARCTLETVVEIQASKLALIYRPTAQRILSTSPRPLGPTSRMTADNGHTATTPSEDLCCRAHSGLNFHPPRQGRATLCSRTCWELPRDYPTRMVGPPGNSTKKTRRQIRLDKREKKYAHMASIRRAKS